MNGRFLKKNVVIVAVAIGVLLIGGALFFDTSQDDDSALIETLEVNRNLEKIVTQTVSVDSDGDGLKDWEEVLFETDPQNPDTDGDGILDGQEDNAVGRNASGEIDRSKIDELPYTEKLAFQLFEGYIDLKQRSYLGTNIEENFVSGLVESSLPAVLYKKYTESDVSVDSQESGDAQIRALAYQTVLNTAWGPLFDVKEDELITFTKIIDNGDTDGFNRLEFAKSKYEETIQNLLNVSVPADAVSIHVDILNSFSFFAGVLDTMINVKDDPLVALVAIDGYTQGEGMIKASIERLKTYLLVSGVTL